MKQFVLLFLGFMPMFLCAQNYIEGMYSHTFSTKLNENGQPIVWAGTINGMYAKMNNTRVTRRNTIRNRY